MNDDGVNNHDVKSEIDTSIEPDSQSVEVSPRASQTDGCSDEASAELEALDVSGGSSSFGTQSDPEHHTESSPSPQPPERITYSVGDHVYFETSTSGPYQIRRIDEFIKNGNSVDAKVFVYSRKSDLPLGIQKDLSGFADGDLDEEEAPLVELIAQRDRPSRQARRRLQEHFTASREAFLNKDENGPVVETLPTSLIRGKCSVLHHVEGPPKCHYTEMENAFFYNRAWYIPTDLQTGEVVVDREKQIHYDSDGVYQAVIPALLKDRERTTYETSFPDKCTLTWMPNRMTDSDVASCIQAAIAVGVMARCVNVSSLGLQEDAVTVARIVRMDGTALAVHDLVHACDYDLAATIQALVGEGLWSNRMLLETFDETDMNFFRIGLHETARNLRLIYEDWLPWRTFADVVAFYYLFKSTSYYQDFRRSKAGAKHEKGYITCVALGKYDSRSCLLRHVPEQQICYGCYGSSDAWYAWTGLTRCRRQARALCASCWDFWKRYACLRRPWKSPPGAFRPTAKSTTEPGGSSRAAVADPYQCISPKPPSSAAKQLLMTHRSPQATATTPLTWTEHCKWEEEKSQADEEEFEYAASDDWKLARRIATESVYDTKKLARYPLLPCGTIQQIRETARAYPSLVVNYFKQPKQYKKRKIDQVISALP